jgi:hypothetical protein
MEKMDVQAQRAERTGFQGRGTWDVTFLANGSVRVEKLVMNTQGQLEEPMELTMLAKRFFKMKPTWSPNSRALKFQNEVIPSLLSAAIDRIG